MSVNKQRLEQKFAEEYQRLNEKQRMAVDAIEGPVMVIAGPGTGKTQILASRIGKILLETDALPENILCLTYTDAGVMAMRRRLLQFIGPDAYKVNISTFHAFCNDVIQENLPVFEKTALDPISDLEKIQLFKELIDSLPKNHPLKRYRGDVYYEVNNLRDLFSTMKREGWTPDYIREKVKAYLEDLPLREEFRYKRKYKQYNAGDLKEDRLEEEREKMTRLLAAVDEFDRFQELMRRRNRYDFDDMINWVIQAFRQNRNLLAGYQERFQYILVDEYQDTSGTQNRLVELLISYWDRPNVFVVGDDDQSIYRFQGANVENMLQFADSYKKDLLTVVLTHNYRSTQPILDVSRTLINRNAERLVKKLDGLSKDLVASNENIRHLTHPPRIREYDTQRQEMIGITLDVERLLAAGTDPGDIGIIYKENKYGEELAQYFKLRKIPYYSKRSLNLLEQPLVRQVVLLLRYLAAEHDTPYGGDELLFELLHLRIFGIAPAEIARLSIEVADRQFGENKTSLRGLLYEKAVAVPRDLFSQGLPDPLKQASRLLEKLIGDVPNLTLQQLFENVVRESGLLSQVMQSPDKLWEMQVLTGLFDFLKEETHRRPLMTLAELVGLVDLMEQEGIALPLAQVTGNEKGVNLLTAHGSKGLEFTYVYFAGCNAGYWEKKRKPAGGYKLPDTMFTSTGPQPAQGHDEEELRRLFYVALTRAEQHLQISYSRFRNDGKELEPSLFVVEITDQQELPCERVILSEETIASFQALSFGLAQAPEIGPLERAFMERLLERFVMNVTALNNYLRCPLEFYYRNLVRIPSPKNEATEFGSAVHYALEQLFRRMQEDGREIFPAREVFLSDFDWYMHRHRESFTREQFERRLEYGHEVLTNYYDNRIDSFNRIVAIERTIRGVVVRGVPLKGKLDKLEFDGKNVNVVDYKTGDPDKARDKLRPPGDKNPDGGDYWRQAVFYKILVDHYQEKNWKALSTEFDFVEPDRKKTYRKEKLVITPADIETVLQQITRVWQRIQDHDFYTGCGREDCHWCQFVKTNNLAVALHDIEEEEPEQAG